MLGSILGGYATPTEAAGVGAMGALLLAALYRALSWSVLREIGASTVKTTSMVFFILIGASVFSLVFRGYGGDDLVAGLFENMPGGVLGATVIVMVVIFLLGFLLDFIEITYVVVPIVGPILLAMGLDPVWLGVMIAVNLQTSLPDATLRLLALLPARRRAARGGDRRHLSRCRAVHRAAAPVAGAAGLRAGARDVVAEGAVLRDGRVPA